MEIIKTQDKKEFLRWLLHHYQLKRRECVWILNYLMSHDQLMKNVHFVDDAQYTPRGIIMSTQCTDAVPFRYYKENVVTTDAEKTFHDIRLNREDDLYIQLNFYNKSGTQHWYSILEENPYLPKHLKTNEEDRKEVNQFVQFLEYDFQYKKLMNKIDETLVNGNLTDFLRLTEELKVLKKNKTNH